MSHYRRLISVEADALEQFIQETSLFEAHTTLIKTSSPFLKNCLTLIRGSDGDYSSTSSVVYRSFAPDLLKRGSKSKGAESAKL